MTDAWYVCKCGHALYDHSARREESQSGLTYSGCNAGRCRCAKWENAAGQDWYDGALRDKWEPAA